MKAINRFAALFMALIMLLSSVAVLVSAEWDPENDPKQVMAYGAGSTKDKEMKVGDKIGPRIHITEAFTAIYWSVPTYHEVGGEFKVEVYEWKASYGKTVEGNAVFSVDMIADKDNKKHYSDVGRSMPAGDYLFLLTFVADPVNEETGNKSRVGLYYSSSNEVSNGCMYVNGKEELCDLWITVCFAENAPAQPFKSVITFQDVLAYGNGLGGDYFRVGLRTDKVGQRVKVTAPIMGFAFAMPTWGNAGCEATLSVYKWNNSYEETVAGEPLVSEHQTGLKDNAKNWVYFDSALPADEYLFLIHEVKGSVAVYYCSENTVSLGYSYVDGAELRDALYLTIRFENKVSTPFEACSGTEYDGTVTVPDEYVIPEDSLINTHPVMPDTWVFTDGLGRDSLTNAQVGDPREDKTVAMFFWNWHITNKIGVKATNIQQTIDKYPEAINDYYASVWDDTTTYYWNEPIYGYYATDDYWVLRRQAELMANAGVDTVFTDNSNSIYTIRDGYMSMYEAWTDAQNDGVKAPKVSFHLAMWGATDDDFRRNTTEQLEFFYNDVYSRNLYPNMWFYFDGKPMILGHARYLDTRNNLLHREIANYFTLRGGEAAYDDARSHEDSVGTWGWSAAYPQPYYFGSKVDIRNKKVEEISVSIAVNYDYVNKCLTAMNGPYTMGRSYSPSYENRFKEEGAAASVWGYHFATQWEYALEVDPRVVYVTGWNEWTVGRHKSWVDVPNAFGDQFSDEFSRDIEPSKGALKDHYYYQLVNYVRQYKGARAIPEASDKTTIDMSAGQDQWSSVDPYYAAYIGNTDDRNYYGRVGTDEYIDYSGRNDIIGAQIARDDEYIYFNVECAEDITSYKDNLWMNLYIDTDQSDWQNGWETFEYVLNKSKASETTSVLERFTGSGYDSEKVADVEYKVDGRYMTVKIAKADLGIVGDDYTINFAWTDNVHDGKDLGMLPTSSSNTKCERIYSKFSGDIMDFYTSGDVAPGARFKFSYISGTGENIVVGEDTTTQADAVTTAVPNEETTAPESDGETEVLETAVDSVATEETNEAGDAAGCKSFVGASAAAILMTAAAATVVLKKKH